MASIEKSVILMYHRVEQSVHDRWHLCVSPANFAAQLRSLRQRFTPVRLTELAERLQSNQLEQGMVALTFDDGYQDNLTVAVPILRQMGIPATFFIAGEGAAIGASFWWEIFDASVRAMDLDETKVTELHRQMMAASMNERMRMLGDLAPPSGSLPVRLTSSDLRALAREPLADIGAHGWSHRAFAGLAVEEQRREMTQNIEVISAVTGRQVEAFAYPFGGPFTKETTHLLRDLGIKVSCTVRNEPVTVNSDVFALPRVEVQDWGGAEFEAVLESLLQ